MLNKIRENWKTYTFKYNLVFFFTFSKTAALLIFKFDTIVSSFSFKKERSHYVYSTIDPKCTGRHSLQTCSGYLSATSHVYFQRQHLGEYESKGLWKSALRKTLLFTKCKVLKIRASANRKNCKTEITLYKISQTQAAYDLWD